MTESDGANNHDEVPLERVVLSNVYSIIFVFGLFFAPACTGPNLTPLDGLGSKRATHSPFPIYIIAHGINHGKDVGEMLNAGANAIEIDLRYSKKLKKWCVNHDHTGYCGLDCLEKLDSLEKWTNDLLGFERKELNKLVLLYLDIKDNDNSPDSVLELRDYLRKLIRDHSVLNGLKLVFSVAHQEEAGILNPLYSELRISEFVSIDQDGDVQASRDYFVKKGVLNYCVSDGIDWRWFDFYIGDRIQKAVLMRQNKSDAQAPKCVFSWTYRSEASMLKYLDLGVDGLIVHNANSVKKMFKIINESPNYRLARREDFMRERVPYKKE